MKKKNNNWFFRILLVLFLVFISLNIAYESGYYETKAHNKAIMTKEAIEQFELDIANNKTIDLQEYLKKDDIDYSNKVTRLGNKIANSLSKFMTKEVSNIFDVLKNLFWN